MKICCMTVWNAWLVLLFAAATHQSVRVLAEAPAAGKDWDAATDTCPCAGEQQWLFATPADAVRFSSAGEGVLELTLEGTRAWSVAFADRPARIATTIKSEELLASEAFGDVRRPMVLAWMVRNESIGLPFQADAFLEVDDGTYRARLKVGDDFNSTTFKVASGEDVTFLALNEDRPMDGVSEHPVLFIGGGETVPAAFQKQYCVCNATGIQEAYSTNGTGSDFVVSSRSATLEREGSVWSLHLEDTHPLSIFFSTQGSGYETTSSVLSKGFWNGTLPNLGLSWGGMIMPFDVLDFEAGPNGEGSYRLLVSPLEEIGNTVPPSMLDSQSGDVKMDNPVLFIDDKYTSAASTIASLYVFRSI
ncbi:hypothetical protein M9435_001141 [Picochlorum sp. BPE23]|nr:hypothetical protein M9435_001141 [Picochlorum sp. BPE23]